MLVPPLHTRTPTLAPTPYPLMPPLQAYLLCLLCLMCLLCGAAAWRVDDYLNPEDGEEEDDIDLASLRQHKCAGWGHCASLRLGC